MNNNQKLIPFPQMSIKRMHIMHIILKINNDNTATTTTTKHTAAYITLPADEEQEHSINNNASFLKQYININKLHLPILQMSNKNDAKRLNNKSTGTTATRVP